VQYLNSRPLICDYDGPVVFDHPSGLARALSAGRLDAALVPVFEVLRDPRYWIVDGVAVACDGAVFSVILAHRGPLSAVQTVALDPASLTSVHLLRVLLAEYHGVRVRGAVAGAPGEGEARLLIGNQAIEFRLGDGGRHELLDLGAEWKRCTGLPFVFAVWALRPGLGAPEEIAGDFRRMKRAGLSALPQIVAGEPGPLRAMAGKYLTQHISYALGEREKAGLAHFGALLAAHGFISGAAGPPRFV
jgi:chorismate dehydratase